MESGERAGKKSGRRIGRILPGMALLALGVAAALPASRWLVWEQMQAQFAPNAEIPNREAEARVLAQHPNDVALHLAAAVDVSTQEPSDLPNLASEAGSVTKTRRLHALEARFPNEPTLPANELRYMSQGAMQIHRDDDAMPILDPYKRDLSWTKTSPIPPKPENLAAFDSAAASGERLDPKNAYFPLMRAVGLFAARRDAEAREALHRAAQKPEWNEYYTDEANGQWRLFQLATGRHDALLRMVQQAAIVFPQYAQIRELVRLAISQAVTAEIAGRNAEGLQIRQDVRRISGLMRAKSRRLFGAQVGIACNNIAMSRPGGAPAGKGPGTGDAVQKQAYYDAKASRYADYLRGISANDEARLAQAEYEAGKSALASRHIEEEHEDTWDLAFFFRVTRWRMINTLVLSNTLGLLFLGLLAGMAAKVKAGPNRTTARFFFGAATFVGLMTWQYRVTSALLGYIATVWGEMPVISITSPLMLSGMALAIPFAIVALLAMVSRCCRVAVGTGVGRGLRVLVVPVASLLLLTYVALLVPIMRTEAHLHTVIDRTQENEGQYRAELTGSAWPGVVR